MRKFFALLAIATLTACGGGGGTGAPNLPQSSTTPQATATPTLPPVPSGDVRPTFTIAIPSRGTATRVRPGFISSGTESIEITLTQVNGSAPGTLTGNPAITNISSATCSGGCTVDGPPSPVGTDTFTLTTYDAAGAAGNALDTATGTYTMTQGANNAETVTLEGIATSLALAALPTTWAAGVSNNTTLALTASDADGETITGTYANPVTVTDNDTNSDGTHVGASCTGFGAQTPSTSGNPTTSVTMTSSSSANAFCYLGLAEPSVTLTATAAGATSGTQTFNPVISAPTSGTTSGAFAGTDAQLSTTTGTGSTGTIAFSETGFTNAPYDQVLSVDTGSPSYACSTGGPLSTFATVVAAASSGTTVFTVTAGGANTPGICAIPVWDGTGAYVPPTFSASYTTSSFTVDKKHR